MTSALLDRNVIEFDPLDKPQTAGSCLERGGLALAQCGQQTEPSIGIGPPSAAPMLPLGLAPFAQRYSGRWIAPSPISPTTVPPLASQACAVSAGRSSFELDAG